MLDQETLSRLSMLLVARAGGYLRNPVRQDRATCVICATPVAGYERCYRCMTQGRAGEADAVAFLTYAVSGQQSGYLMRGYKARSPVEEHRTVVTLLCLVGLSTHERCPAVLGEASITHWATVPSLPAKPGVHPLRSMVSSVVPGQEVPLIAAAAVADPRDVNSDHFSATARMQRGSHVLLVDDTWAGGGHAQSAALALRKAGAQRVSVMVVARWIKKDYAGNAAFLRTIAGRDYDPRICPWTGGACP
jgi:hypothetical protein